jgi:citrate synthase
MTETEEKKEEKATETKEEEPPVEEKKPEAVVEVKAETAADVPEVGVKKEAMPEIKETTFDIKKGLEGVVVAESGVCFIDGEKGVLLYRGYNIADLAPNCSYEEISFLLVNGRLPNKKELQEYKRTMALQRQLPKRVIRLMQDYCGGTTGMEALRTTVSALACHDPDVLKVSLEDHRRNGIDLVAKFPTMVAAYERIRSGKKPVRPDPKLDHAANFLYMLTRKKPDKVSARAMDTDFILHAEHGFNASTFAARVTISTLSDIHSAITSGVGTLKGPLHGGAAEEAWMLLNDIGKPENAENYVKAALARKEKIMGFGHRVYKVYDPRAKILKKMAFELSKQKKDMSWYNTAVKVEETMIREKNINPNVDFYSSVVYRELGIPLDLDSPIFAIGRISGWVAHALEQYADNKLIRPREQYTGSMGEKFVPLDKRK